MLQHFEINTIVITEDLPDVSVAQDEFKKASTPFCYPSQPAARGECPLLPTPRYNPGNHPLVLRRFIDFDRNEKVSWVFFESVCTQKRELTSHFLSTLPVKFLCVFKISSVLYFYGDIFCTRQRINISFICTLLFTKNCLFKAHQFVLEFISINYQRSMLCSICLSNGRWAPPTSSECVRTQCPSLEYPNVTCTNGNFPESVCNRTCPTGYKLFGPSSKVIELTQDNDSCK